MYFLTIQPIETNQIKKRKQSIYADLIKGILTLIAWFHDGIHMLSLIPIQKAKHILRIARANIICPNHVFLGALSFFFIVLDALKAEIAPFLSLGV